MQRAPLKRAGADSAAKGGKERDKGIQIDGLPAPHNTSHRCSAPLKKSQVCAARRGHPNFLPGGRVSLGAVQSICSSLQELEQWDRATNCSKQSKGPSSLGKKIDQKCTLY